MPLTMRGVPDVAGDADPETGYDVRVDGTDTVIGGTSAVAPLWAALIARINALDRESSGLHQSAALPEPAGLARHHAAATTAILPPKRAGMPARDSAARTARRCRRSCDYV